MKTIYMKQSTASPLEPSLSSSTFSTPRTSDKVWHWGQDNLLPVALCAISRSSVTHRRILQDKSDYISGRGFKCSSDSLTAFCRSCNPSGQTLRSVVQRLALDKALLGNATLEIVIRDSQVALFHQDACRARLALDKQHIIFHHDWAKFKLDQSVSLPIFPLFEKCSDGTLRSVVHYKDYEPMFENYGTPKYIAALGAIAIAHKTDRWNISRIDNAFQLSGVMILDGRVDSEDQAAQIARDAERRFKGTPGQVMFLVKDGAQDGDSSKFVPINSESDGDWRQLHEQSTADIIVAHSWFRTLSGLEYVSGFSADRVQNEYNIALSTIIRSEQQEIIEPIVQMLSEKMAIDASDLTFVNTPPFDSKPGYMKVWEARKADGLAYNERDETQNQFLNTI